MMMSLEQELQSEAESRTEKRPGSFFFTLLSIGLSDRPRLLMDTIQVHGQKFLSPSSKRVIEWSQGFCEPHLGWSPFLYLAPH
jgi:hypothetical protein